jgi:adenylate kinase family enzyme
MTNYQNGKVYKIECINGKEGDIYVGSTAKQYLSQRMTKHRNEYKYWKEGKAKYLTAYDLFDKYGIENCSIILLETCPCNSKDELRAREGFHTRNLACVNKRVEGRTHKEWRDDNKESIKQKKHDYRLNNKEGINIYSRERYEKNKITLREKITCECGSTCSRGSMSEHKKTKKHKNYENSLIQT